MIFTDGTQNRDERTRTCIERPLVEFKPMNKLKLEIKNLQALNIKGSLNFIMNLIVSALKWTVESGESVRSIDRTRSRKRPWRYHIVICIKVNGP